jgi:hypothetical protein
MNIDFILIENQIGPIANRMNSIQGMLTQYFIMKGLYNIKYVSASNKLKNLIEKNTSYSERKKQSILIAKDILIQKNIDNTMFVRFEGNYTDYDTVTYTNSSGTRFTANPELWTAKISIGKSF